MLGAATQSATVSEHVPVVLADGGVENVNAQIDALLATGVLRRLLGRTELKFSNSMIEAWWRSLKHHWLFLHALDSVATVRRLVAFSSTNTTACCRMRHFTARRQTRCTLGRAMRSRRNWRRARTRRAGHACRPTVQ